MNNTSQEPDEKAGLPVKLLCHIGMPQTSAHWMQSALAANPDWLAARGFVYGDLGDDRVDHDVLPFACARKVLPLAAGFGMKTEGDMAKMRKHISDRLAAQIEASSDHAHTLILSSDALGGRLRQPEEVKAVHDLLAPLFDDITIVAYLRRQDDAVLAQYADMIARGTTDEPLVRFARGVVKNANTMLHLDYRRSLTGWLEAFGGDAMIIRRYAPGDFVGGEPVTDFLGVLLGQWEPETDGFSMPLDPRPPLSATAIAFLRLLNGDNSPLGRPQRDALLRHFNQLPPIPTPILPQAEALRIMDHFHTSNDWLKTTFAPGMEGAFFPERPDHPEFTNLDRLTTEDAVTLAGELLSAVLRGAEG